MSRITVGNQIRQQIEGFEFPCLNRLDPPLQTGHRSHRDARRSKQSSPLRLIEVDHYAKVYPMPISGTVTQPEAITPPLEGARDFAKEQVQRWCAACQTFLTWERDVILMGKPSEQEKQEHRATLKWLLRVSKLFHASTTDADFPDRSMGNMLEMTVWKLEQSWKMNYEPMPEAEADKLLAKIFPG